MSKSHRADGTTRTTVDLPPILAIPLQKLADRIKVADAEAIRVVLAKMFGVKWIGEKERKLRRIRLSGEPMTPSHENDLRGVP